MDIKGLQRLIVSMKNRKIPYQVSTSWSRNSDEGFNSGIDECVKVIESKIKRISKAKTNGTKQ